MSVPNPVFFAPLTNSVNPSIGSGVTYARAGNATVLKSGVLVTKSTNQARFTDYPAYLTEGGSTNEALYSRDFTNAAWVKTNGTAAKDAIGLDGVANSASTLTATSGNFTTFQTITKSSDENTFSIDVRRKTGSGTVEITDNGGTNYTSISINSSTYTRFEITRTQSNPSIGFRIVTSGDEIEVDYAQLEELGFATSRIEVPAGTPITRAADQLSYDASNWPTLNAPFSIATTSRSNSDGVSQVIWDVNGLGHTTRLGTSSGALYRFIYGGKTATDSTGPSTAGMFRETGTWLSGGSHLLYRDGSLVNTKVAADTTGTVTDIKVGRESVTLKNWFGEIYDFKIWGVELTADQVLEEFEEVDGIALTSDLTSDLTRDLTTDLTG